MTHQRGLPDTREAVTLAGITARSAFWAVVLTVATYLGITRLGFIRINWVPYVVPPVPALLFLLLLQGCNLVLARWQRAHFLPHFLRPLTQAELLLIYAAVCASLAMERGGYILHYLMVPEYFGTDANNWKPLFDLYPAYYIPHNTEIVRQWFEGAPQTRIPWEYWWAPLAWWSAFNLTLTFGVFCLVSLFRKQWSEDERLTFPLLFLPLEIVGIGARGGSRLSVAKGFFRNPIMWVGFAVATAFNGLNISHAFFPAIPGIRYVLPLATGIGEGVLRYIRPLNMSFALELWGLSYLVSGEVLFSGWFFYFFMKLVKLFGRSLGYNAAGFPYFQEASAGGCIGFVLFMLWVARPRLREIARCVWRGPSETDRQEAFPYRVQILGLVVSGGVVTAMLAHAGLAPSLTGLWLLSLGMFVVLAARIRAEVGPPVLWTHPYGFDQIIWTQLLGTKAIRQVWGVKSTVLFYGLFYVGRTVFAHSAGQYFIDGLRLADDGRVKRRAMAGLMLFICVVGMALTFWYHLDVGYKFGQGLIGAKVGRAGTGWGMNWSKGQYRLLRNALDRPQLPDGGRLVAYGGGFLLVLVLTMLRTRLCNFPFHPLGFILATLYGDYSPYWWPFLVAYLAQRITLRYGGLPAYRRIVPAFLGLFLGHCLIGGVLWRIIINYFIDPTISYRYYLNLGG